MTYLELLNKIRQYQSFIYTGSKEADLDLIEEEVQELFRLGMVDHHFFKEARLTIMQERRKLK